VSTQEESFKQKIEFREKNVVMMEKEVFEASLASHMSDAIILSEIVGIHLTDSLDPSELHKRLGPQLETFARNRKVYDQVRYLDKSGMEVVRVNMERDGPATVPQKDLQDKGTRTYFIKGMRAKGKVHVSRLDLNQEFGAIEEPFKPVIRIATPVVGENGRTLGLVVLNYMGSELLDRLRRASENSDGQILLVNPSGYWIIGPSGSDEWGFLLQNRKSRSMPAQFPQPWTRIVSNAKGQFASPHGLFTFTTISPMFAHSPAGRQSIGEDADESWKIVSHVPAHRLEPPWWNKIVWLVALLEVLLGVVVWQWARSRVNRHDAIAALADSEEKLRLVSDSIQDAIVMIDGAGDITYWSSYASQMFGYQPSDVRGRNIHSLVAPERYRLEAEKGMDLFKRTGKGTVLNGLREITAMRRGGEEFPAEISVAAIEMKNEWYAVGSIRDITDRKRVEEQLVKHQEHLEDIVQDRTRELTTANRDLQLEATERMQAQEELKKAKQDLEVRVAERTAKLSDANRELSLLSEMGGLLIACTTADEACNVTVRFAQELFAGYSGGIYISSEPRNLLQLIAQWGESPPEELFFSPDKCWALRRGRVHSFHSSSPDPSCSHIPDNSLPDHMCVPMMAQGETLGLLHVRSDQSVSPVSGESGNGFSFEMQRRAIAVSENIGITIANLRLRETLRRQSVRDPLTGIFNRRHMEESLEREFFRAERLGGMVGVVMFDLDHFKLFNDTHGHEAGDELLRAIGKLLAENLRKGDIPCRFGGEEFVAILPGTTLDQAVERAEQLRELIEAIKVIQDRDDKHEIAASFGVAGFPEHGANAQEVLRMADAALYLAKSRGRNRVVAAGSDQEKGVADGES
ncbi:diguanylate cyclase, partial [Thermodesulfobacteriota bacterium]